MAGTKHTRGRADLAGRLLPVIDRLDVGIAITDAAGNILSLNAEARRMHGFPAAARVGGQVSDYAGEFELRYPDGRPMPFEEWPSSRAARGDYVRDCEVLVHRRGRAEPRHVRYSVVPIRDRDGREMQRVFVMVDVSDLKRAQEELRRGREDLARAQAVGQIGSWRLDVGRNVLTWSDENHRIFGIPRGTPLTYETFLGAVHPDDRAFVDARWKAGLAGEPYDVEHRILLAGKVRWVREKAFIELDPAGALLGGFGITQDITDRKLAEQRLQELNESLEQRVAERTAEVDRRVDQVRVLSRQLLGAEQRERKRLARVLHDHVQQLLVGARMRLDLMARERTAKGMRAAAASLDAVLREAIEASHSLAVDLSPPVLHESGLIGGLRWQAARMGETHQFSVVLRADAKAEPATDEVRVLLFECARELLLNALKHSGVTEAQVTLHRTRGDRIELIVSDAGRGFEPERLRKRPSDDVTLGLSGIRERLVLLGGGCEISTAPGKGTRVTLTVPAGPAPPREARRPAEPLAKSEPGGRIRVRRTREPCRVLIVDDHKIMREGLRGLFEFEPGLDVVGEAADGASAVDLAERLAPDVVVMDVNLGDMNGVEATRRILARRPRVKVVGLSMHTDPGVAAAMRAAGAAAYLTKGGPAEGLIAAIRGCVRRGPGTSKNPSRRR